MTVACNHFVWGRFHEWNQFFLNWFYRRLSILCAVRKCASYFWTQMLHFFCCSCTSFTRAVTMLRCVCVSGQFFSLFACPPLCRWIHIGYRFDDFVLTTTSMPISEFSPVESLAFYSTNKTQHAYFVFFKEKISRWFEFFCKADSQRKS